MSPRSTVAVGQAWARLWRALEDAGHVQDGVVLAQVHQLDQPFREALAEAHAAGYREAVDLAEAKAQAVDLGEATTKTQAN